MTARPRDWSPLGLSSDPTPGDAERVAGAGRHYREVAEAIETAARRLREIAGDSQMKSEAVEEFVSSANGVASDISKAQERYANTGAALSDYSTALALAQNDADAALREATTAREDMQQADRNRASADDDLTRARTANDALPPDQPAADLTGLQASVNRFSQAHSEASGRLEAAQRKAEDARKDAEDAADRARRRIEDAIDRSDLNDSKWDDIAAGLASLASFMGNLAAFCGVAALLVGWIPVIGQALAAALGAIALVAGVISLLANTALLIGGKGDLKSVLLDLAGVLSFGLGRAVIGGSRAVMAGVRAASRLQAGRLAAAAPAIRASRGLPAMGSSRATIRALLGNDGLAALSRSSARDLVNTARNARLLSPSAPFRAAADDLMSLPRNVMTAFTPSNLAAAGRQMPGAFTDLVHSRSMAEGVARMTQDTATLDHLATMRGVNDAVSGLGDLALRSNLTSGITAGTFSVSAGIDGYQTWKSDLWHGGPADKLNLDAR